MRGIVCYVGDREARPLLLEGLKRLEYRGYDSASLAIQNSRHIHCHRSVGKIVHLERKLNGTHFTGATGIAHTRWATHGEPSETNAHPHSAHPGFFEPRPGGCLLPAAGLPLRLLFKTGCGQAQEPGQKCDGGVRGRRAEGEMRLSESIFLILGLPGYIICDIFIINF